MYLPYHEYLVAACLTILSAILTANMQSCIFRHHINTCRCIYVYDLCKLQILPINEMNTVLRIVEFQTWNFTNDIENQIVFCQGGCDCQSISDTWCISWIIMTICTDQLNMCSIVSCIHSQAEEPHVFSTAWSKNMCNKLCDINQYDPGSENSNHGEHSKTKQLGCSLPALVRRYWPMPAWESRDTKTHGQSVGKALSYWALGLDLCKPELVDHHKPEYGLISIASFTELVHGPPPR